MTTQYTYPSLGEAIKYFVSTMGILPRKNEVKENTNTSEAEKKKIQKQIERLAREEGHLQAQFDALIPSINNYLKDSISCPIVAAQICSVANKLHDSYKELLVSQGTFMSQRDTVLYFIKNFAIEACVTESSLAYLIYQDLRPDAVWPEEDFWYLPEERDGKIVWPITNAMKWAYSVTDLSQTQFHKPADSQDVFNRLENNLKNASKWTRGKSIPSMLGLTKNIRDSLEAQENNGKKIPSEVKDSILATTSLSLALTSLAQDVKRNYGNETLFQLTDQIKKYVYWIREDIDEFQKNYSEEIQLREIDDNISAQKLKYKMLSTYIPFFHDKCQQARHPISEYILNQKSIDRAMVNWLAKKYGNYAAKVPEYAYDISPVNVPEGFSLLMPIALTMINDNNITSKDIDDFSNSLQAYNLDKQLPWVTDWLYGGYYYKKDDFEKAHQHFQKSFQYGKYRAGNTFYRTLNQHIELCAKLDKWREFKKSALWAKYLGIPVRWLRDEEPTDENLRVAYNFLGLKNCKYPRL